MKTGRTLTELAAEIERQAATSRDFVADTRALSMTGDASLAIDGANLPALPVSDIAHQQIATHVGIPTAYYRRMRDEAPDLLARNVNRWLHADAGKPVRRMVRTLDGRARAFLSDAYRPLGNLDLAEAVLPALQQLGVIVMSAEITERRFYLKVVDEAIQAQMPTGRKLGDGSHVFFDTVSPAMVISNSEVGMGALSIETAIYTRLCTNLAIASQHSMRKYHVGRRADMGEELYAMLSPETRQLTDRAVWSQARDLVKGAFDRARFDVLVKQVAATAEQKIEAPVERVVEVATREFGLPDGTRPSVLKHLIEFGSLTQYGLHAAITRASADVESYDDASDMERVGGKVIELSPAQWQKLNDRADDLMKKAA